VAEIEKMSAVLESFVEPYMEMAATEAGFRCLLNLGVVAWNASLLPADEQREKIDKLLEKRQVPQADATSLRSLLRELLDRKKAYYGANRRAIINYVLRDSGNGYHLSVMSSLPVPPAT
jgi:hypothetical protein